MIIFNTYQSLPDGKSHRNPMKNHHFPMVFLWFSYWIPRDHGPRLPWVLQGELDLSRALRGVPGILAIFTLAESQSGGEHETPVLLWLMVITYTGKKHRKMVF